MRKLLFLFSFLFSLSVCFSQTTALSFTTITTDYIRPGSGTNNWNDEYQVVPVPPGYAGSGLDRYTRFAWNQMQNDDGTYNFTAFDIRVQAAINAGQKYGFGLMPYCEGCNATQSPGGTPLTYPLFLHTQMQGEAVKDFQASDQWVPNWNSISFMTAWKALLVAVANHIATTTFNGVPYSKIINYIDVRGYGNFGEWHNFPYTQPGAVPAYPAAIIPTSAVLDTLIQSHIDNFPNNPLSILIGAYDHGDNINIPLDVTYFALTAHNNYGPIGWRRDNWGDEVNYVNVLENNPNTFNGLVFKTAIMSRYQTSPITGEPLNGAPAAPTYSAMATEMIRYGGNSFGNGNVQNPTNATVVANIQAGSKAAGYRLQFASGSISTTITQNATFALTLNWQNIGVAPCYEKWNVQFELRNGATVVQTWTSSFQPKLFLPGSRSVTDNLLINNTTQTGGYSLYLIIRDSTAYRKPMPLSQTGQQTDGSYFLSGVTVTTGSINSPPVSHPGGNQTITLPVSTVTFSGSGTAVAPATGITGFLWTKVSGPASGLITNATAASTTVTGLTQGTYVFNLRVTDNLGLTGNATVTITVNPAPVLTPPIVTVGANQVLTLPTNSTTITGTATPVLPSTSITTYLWTKVSGPTTFSIATPGNPSTVISGLVQGVYVFRLTATDNNGLSNSATIQITVNQKPTVTAAANQTIVLPTSTVSVTGTATPQLGGTIVLRSWVKTSGPAGGTITTPTAATTTITGLTQGIYVFTFTATDNNGNSNSAFVTITVNQKPTANAGANQVITLPVNSVSLAGSGTAQPGGTITTYKWTKTAGPATFTITNSNVASTTVTGLIQGVYTFTLTVTDNHGLTGTSTVQITVNKANTPPTANAGVNQTITLPTNLVTVNGSGTAILPATSITNYLWSKTSGPAGNTITSATSASTTITGLVQGTYVFRLTVTDNNGLTGSASVTITVNPAPLPPTANAGTNKTIQLPVNTTTLVGSGTFFAPAISITTYLWTKTAGPATFTIVSPNSSTTNITGLVQGTYTFTLTVTDNRGQQGSSNVTVVVNAANEAPTANAGAPQTITLPVSSVTLNGSGTAILPATSITTYLWDKIAGPATFTITSPNTASTSVTGLIQGTYTFRLTVTDNNGLTASSNVNITVNHANLPPTANAGAPQTITLPINSVTLTGSGIPILPATSITNYAWLQTFGPAVTITSPSSVTTTVTSMVQGTYIFQLTVTDNKGLTGTSTVQVTVNPAPNPPVVNAGSNQTLLLPTNTATLTGMATAVLPATSISSYLWTKLSGPATFTIASPTTASTGISNLVQGIYVFNLMATDNNGNASSATVQITVNQIPTVNAGPNQVITLPVTTVLLSGTVTAQPGGTIASVLWTKFSGPASFTFSPPSTTATTVSNLVQGVYVFQLTATDNLGNSNSSTIQVTVNQNPVANAGTNQTISLPVNTVTLNGSGTAQPGGFITTYAWSKISGPTTFTIVSPASATTNITNLIQGTYVFQLTVTDNNGNTGSSQVTITVNPTKPTANAGSNQTVTLPANSTTLVGSGTAFSPATSIVTYLWTKTSGPALGTISTPNTATTNITGLVQGTYVFTLTVTDNNGLTGSSPVTVTVNTFISGCNCILYGGNGKTTIIIGNNRVPVWGTKLHLDSLPICISPSVMSSNYVVNLPTKQLMIAASATGHNGSGISSYFWKQVSGNTITILNAQSNTPLITNISAAGILIVNVTVKDSCGASSNMQDTIVVNAAPPTKYATNITWTVNATTLYVNWSDGTFGTIALPAGKKVQYTAAYSGTSAKMIVGFTDGTTKTYP